MSKTMDWIRVKLIDCNMDTKGVESLHKIFRKDTNSKMSLRSFQKRISEVYSVIMDEKEKEICESDIDLSEKLVKLSSHKQKLQDSNRVVKKENRENYRLYNFLESLYEENIKLLKKVNLSNFKIKKHKILSKPKYGIIQLSDHHLNEEIKLCDTSDLNQFNFEIASKRLKKYITKSIHYLKSNSVTSIAVCFTGDLINSDRRLSEKMSAITSNSRACLLAVHLYTQIIVELSEHFNVKVYGVVGNESRTTDFFETTDILASQNYDFLIYNSLRQIFSFAKSPIEFSISSPIEEVLSFDNGFKAVLTHGNLLKGKDMEKSVEGLLKKYLFKNIVIRAVFIGHIHETRIGDFVSRSSSLSGGNAYSSSDLNRTSRASQNVYIINNDLSYDGIKIDVQDLSDLDNYEGYHIIEELERYHISNNKYNNKVVITNLV